MSDEKKIDCGVCAYMVDAAMSLETINHVFDNALLALRRGEFSATYAWSLRSHARKFMGDLKMVEFCCREEKEGK